MNDNSSSRDEIVAAILCGGKGTRLQPVVSNVPKSLAPVAGEPFLFHLIQLLSQLGIKKIVLLTGHMHDAIFTACGDGKKFGVEISYSRETEPLGTAGAIYHAKNILMNHEHFIVLNGDTFFDESITALINKPMQNEIGLIGVTPLNEPSQYGSIQFDDNHHIHSFLEKNLQSTDYVSAGIYKFSKNILEKISEKFSGNQMVSLEQDIFPELILQKNILKAIVLQGQFHDIGTPERYNNFNKKISQGNI
jgi:NDP-sugar pyrophosphorylase family protein